MKTILRTAKLDEAVDRVQFGSPRYLFESNYSQTGPACSPITYSNRPDSEKIRGNGNVVVSRLVKEKNRSFRL